MKTRVLKHRFTLVELLAVVGILGFLMAMGLGVYALVHRKMNDSKCKAMIAQMATAMENYKSKHGYYIQQVATSALYIDKYDTTGIQPNLNNEIEIPAKDLGGTNGGFPNNRGAWLDPFGNEFRYRCPGKHNPMSFDLYSPGLDMQGTLESPGADDLSNWSQ